VTDRSRAVSTTNPYFLQRKAPDHLEDWTTELSKIRELDDYRVVDESDDSVAWAEPDPEPLPGPAPGRDRSGTCFDVESTEMREACVDTIGPMIGADDAVLHEVRHQRSGYHTDLVYADVDPDGLAARRSVTVGTEPIHDPLQRFKVWWYLYENGPKPRTKAVENGRYSKPSKNRKHLDWLLDHGYAAATSAGAVDAVVPPSICDLHAVELKRRDWETALEQAARSRRCDVDEDGVYGNLWPKFFDRYGYADYAWVALDAGAIGPAIEHADRFRELGVGLLAIAEGGTVVKHIDAEHRPRNRYTRDRAYAESQVWARIDHREYVDTEETATSRQATLT